MAFLFDTKLEFVAKIKSKYPEYTNTQDAELYDKVIAKYPEYKTQIKENMSNVLSTSSKEGDSLTKANTFATQLGVDKDWVGPIPTDTSTLSGYSDYTNLVKRRVGGEDRSFGDAVVRVDKSYIPFIGDFLKIGSLVGLKDTAEKLQTGQPITDQEVLDLNKYLEMQKWMGSSSLLASVTDITKGALVFIAEFALSLGFGKAVAKTGSEIAEKVAMKGLSRAIKSVIARKGFGAIAERGAATLVGKSIAGKLITKAVASKGAKVATIALNTGLGGAFVTALKTGTTLSNKARNEFIGTLTGDDELKQDALYKGLLDNYFENVSELSGGALGKGLSKLFGYASAKLPARLLVKLDLAKSKIAQLAIGRWFASKIGNPEKVKEILGQLSKGAYNGPFNEMLEERYGDFLRGLFGVQGKAGIFNAFKQATPSLHQLAVESIAFSIPYGGAIAFANYGKAIDTFKDLIGKPINTGTKDAGSLKEEPIISNTPFSSLFKQAKTEFPKFNTKIDALNTAIHSKTTSDLQKIPLYIAAQELLSGSMASIKTNDIFTKEAASLYSKLGVVQRDALNASFDTSSLQGVTTPIGGNSKDIQDAANAKQEQALNTFGGNPLSTTDKTIFENATKVPDAQQIIASYGSIEEARNSLPDSLVVSEAAYTIASTTGDRKEKAKDLRIAIKDANSELNKVQLDNTVEILLASPIILDSYKPSTTQPQSTTEQSKKDTLPKGGTIIEPASGALPASLAAVEPVKPTKLSGGTPIKDNIAPIESAKPATKLSGGTPIKDNIAPIESAKSTTKLSGGTPIKDNIAPIESAKPATKLSGGTPIKDNIAPIESAKPATKLSGGTPISEPASGSLPSTLTAVEPANLIKGAKDTTKKSEPETNKQNIKDLKEQLLKESVSNKVGDSISPILELARAKLIASQVLGIKRKTNSDSYTKTLAKLDSAIKEIADFVAVGTTSSAIVNPLKDINLAFKGVEASKNIQTIKDILNPLYRIANASTKRNRSARMRRADTERILKEYKKLGISSIEKAQTITKGALLIEEIPPALDRVGKLTTKITAEREKITGGGSLSTELAKLKERSITDLTSVAEMLSELVDGASVASLEASTETGITPAKVLDLIEKIEFNPELILKLSSNQSVSAYAAIEKKKGNVSSISLGASAMPSDVLHEVFHHIMTLLPSKDMLSILEYLVNVHSVQIPSKYKNILEASKGASEKEFWDGLVGYAPNGRVTKQAPEIVVDAFLKVISYNPIGNANSKTLINGVRITRKALDIMTILLPKSLVNKGVKILQTPLEEQTQQERFFASIIRKVWGILKGAGGLIRDAYTKRGGKILENTFPTITKDGQSGPTSKYALDYSATVSTLASRHKKLTRLFINLIKPFQQEAPDWTKEQNIAFSKAIETKTNEVRDSLKQTNDFGGADSTALEGAVATVMSVVQNMAYNVAMRSNFSSDLSYPERSTMAAMLNQDTTGNNVGLFPVISPQTMLAIKSKFGRNLKGEASGRVVISRAVSAFYDYPFFYRNDIPQEVIDSWYYTDSKMSGVDTLGNTLVKKENFDYTIRTLREIEKDTTSASAIKILEEVANEGAYSQEIKNTIIEGYTLREKIASGMSATLQKPGEVTIAQSSSLEAINIDSWLTNEVTLGTGRVTTMLDLLLVKAIKNWHSLVRIDYKDIVAYKANIVANMVRSGVEIIKTTGIGEVEGVISDSGRQVSIDTSPSVTEPDYGIDETIREELLAYTFEHVEVNIQNEVREILPTLAQSESGSTLLGAINGRFPDFLGGVNTKKDYKLLSHVAVMDNHNKLIRLVPLKAKNTPRLEKSLSPIPRTLLGFTRSVVKEVSYQDTPTILQGTKAINRADEILKTEILKLGDIEGTRVLYMKLSTLEEARETSAEKFGEENSKDSSSFLLSTYIPSELRDDRNNTQIRVDSGTLPISDQQVLDTLDELSEPIDKGTINSRVNSLLSPGKFTSSIKEVALPWDSEDPLDSRPERYVFINSLLRKMELQIQGKIDDPFFRGVTREEIIAAKPIVENEAIKIITTARELNFAGFLKADDAFDRVRTIAELLGLPIDSSDNKKTIDDLLEKYKLEIQNQDVIIDRLRESVEGLKIELVLEKDKKKQPADKLKKKVNNTIADGIGDGAAEVAVKDLEARFDSITSGLLGGGNNSGVLFSSEDTGEAIPNVKQAYKDLAKSMVDKYSRILIEKPMSVDEFKAFFFRAEAIKLAIKLSGKVTNADNMEKFMDDVLNPVQKVITNTITTMLERLGVSNKKKLSDISDEEYDRLREELETVKQLYAEAIANQNSEDNKKETGTGEKGGDKSIVDSNGGIPTEDKLVAKLAARLESVPKAPKSPDAVLETLRKGLLRVLDIPSGEKNEVATDFERFANILNHRNFADQIVKDAAAEAVEKIGKIIDARLKDPNVSETRKNALLLYQDKITSLSETGLPLTLIASSKEMNAVISKTLKFLNTSIRDWVSVTPLQRLSSIGILGNTVKDELVSKYNVHTDIAELVASYVKLQTQERITDLQVKHLETTFQNNSKTSKPIRPWASRLMKHIFAGALENLNNEDTKTFWENELALKFNIEGGISAKTQNILKDYSNELEQIMEASPLIKDTAEFEKSPQYIEWLQRFTTAMQHVKGFTKLEKTIAIFYSNILTGMSVAETNLISTTANTIASVFSKSLNDYVLAKHKGETKNWGDFFRSMQAAWAGFKESRAFAKDIFKSGQVKGGRFTSAQQLGKQVETNILEHSPFGGIAEVLNNYKYVGRSLKAQDYIFGRSAAKHDMFNVLQKETIAREYTREEGDLWIALHIIGEHAGYDLATEAGLNKAGKALEKIRAKYGETSKQYVEFLNGFATINRANTIATSEGFTPKTFDYYSRVEGLLFESLPEELQTSARRSAGRATFNILSDDSSESDPIYDNTVLNAVSKGIQSAKQKVPYFQFIVPFTNIVSTVLNTSMDYLPFLSSARINKAKEAVYPKTNIKKFTDREIGEMQAKRLMGAYSMTGLAAIALTAAAAAADGEDPWFEITATGPRDRKLRNQLRETGFQENTIKIGSTHFDFSVTPFAIPFAIIGSVADYVKYDMDADTSREKNSSMSSIAAYALLKTIPAVLNQSFLTNLNDFMEIVMTDNEVSGMSKAKKFFARIGTSIIPGNLNLFKQISRTLDPSLYSADSIAELFMREMPLPWIKGAYLTPRINAFGEEITLGSSAASLGIMEAMLRTPKRLGRFISFNTRASDPDWMYVVQHRLRIPIPSKNTLLQGVRMSDKQLYAFSKIKGILMKSYVSYMRTRGKWIGVSQEVQQKDISRVSSKYTTWVKAAILSGDYDSLRAKAKVFY